MTTKQTNRLASALFELVRESLDLEPNKEKRKASTHCTRFGTDPAHPNPRLVVPWHDHLPITVPCRGTRCRWVGGLKHCENGHPPCPYATRVLPCLWLLLNATEIWRAFPPPKAGAEGGTCCQKFGEHFPCLIDQQGGVEIP